MEEHKIHKAIFHTEGYIEEIKNRTHISQKDDELWKKAYEILNGQIGYVIPNFIDESYYTYLGLENDEKAKEFSWTVEQNLLFGSYVDDREGFDKVWDAGEYSPDGCIIIPKKYVEVIE